MLPWPAAVSSSQIRTRHHGIHPTTSELATNPIILLVSALQHSTESAPSINPVRRLLDFRLYSAHFLIF
jgi:hypothetical protein